jgi:nucleotide-binding universal stress UspA family protein
MKIMVPLDGSETAEGALPSAIQLARLPGVTAILVSVVPANEAVTTWTRRGNSEPPNIWVDPDGQAIPRLSSGRGALESETQAQERLEAQARDYLAAIAERFPAGVEIAVEMGDDVAEELIRMAGAKHPDLIVMATHGRSGLARMITGSVTEKLLRSRVAPMLLTGPNQVIAALD